MGVFAPPAFRSASFIISPASPEAIGDYISNFRPGNINSQVNPTAQLVYYTPFWLTDPVTVFKVAWGNGAAVAGNVDVGVYNADANGAPATRLAAAGATAMAGVSGLQEVDTTDTILPGDSLYYLGFVATDAATAAFSRFTFALGEVEAMGVCTQASQTSLPATATPAKPGGAVVFLPLHGIACRTIAV